MLRTKVAILVLPLTMLGLFGAAVLPQAAYPRTDYEEYLIVETNNEQKLGQENTGSGSSTNTNCGTNMARTNLAQPITCPNVPGGGNDNGQLPRLAVTQRSAPTFTTSTVSTSIPEQFAVSIAPCNDDEVVTGGGYEFDTSQGTTGNEHPIMEKATGNAWSVYVNIPFVTFKAHAECAKLVP